MARRSLDALTAKYYDAIMISARADYAKNIYAPEQAFDEFDIVGLDITTISPESLADFTHLYIEEWGRLSNLKQQAVTQLQDTQKLKRLEASAKGGRNSAGKTSEAKKKASRENGKKYGGRPITLPF